MAKDIRYRLLRIEDDLNEVEEADYYEELHESLAAFLKPRVAFLDWCRAAGRE